MIDLMILICSFECSDEYKARWLSWLERRPVTAEVVGSSPIRVAFIGNRRFLRIFSIFTRDLSSAGRAPALQAGGHRFEPCRSHLK